VPVEAVASSSIRGWGATSLVVDEEMWPGQGQGVGSTASWASADWIRAYPIRAPGRPVPFG
jgi:hypothetical protein